MAKPNKKQIERLLAEGASLTVTMNEISDAQAIELAPLEAEFRRKQQKLNDWYGKATSAVLIQRGAEWENALARRNEIEVEIRKELQLGISGNDVAVSVIEYAGAKASVEQTKAEAALEPKALLDAVPKAEQDAAFFDCLKVQIGNARKYLGKKFEELASVKKHFAVTIKWS